MKEKMFNKIYLQVEDYDGEESTEELITFAPIKVNDSDVEYMKTSHVFEFIDWFFDETFGNKYLQVNDEPRKYVRRISSIYKTKDELYNYWLTNIKEHE